MDIESLLAVLDMSEDEQWDWVFSQSAEILATGNESLADLAFRLRSEVELYQWNCAIREIIEYLIPDFTEKEKRRWWIKEAKPIHWIIAGLIAQSEEKK